MEGMTALCKYKGRGKLIIYAQKQKNQKPNKNIYKPVTNTGILIFKTERFWNNQKLAGEPEKMTKFTIELIYDKHFVMGLQRPKYLLFALVRVCLTSPTLLHTNLSTASQRMYHHLGRCSLTPSLSPTQWLPISVLRLGSSHHANNLLSVPP